MTEVTLTLTNPTGLHARPAAQFVQKAAKFKSSVKITANNKTIDAKSILAVMSMALAKGTVITISADGLDEQECIQTLRELVETNFGEKS